MSDFEMPDMDSIISALDELPMDLSSSDKGRFFRDNWWPNHQKEVMGRVLRNYNRDNVKSFDKRVDTLYIAQQVDAANGSQLDALGFTPSEITTYVNRSINKRLNKLGEKTGAYYVIRNQKLVKQLEHKPA